MLILILRDWQPDRLTSTAETEKITADFCQIRRNENFKFVLIRDYDTSYY